MGALRPWHIAILVTVMIVLFGAKRLPDAARSVGRSMRILKAETRGLHDDDAAAATPAETFGANLDRTAQLDSHASARPIVEPVQLINNQ